jgi:hypothetical protein
MPKRTKTARDETRRSSASDIVRDIARDRTRDVNHDRGQVFDRHEATTDFEHHVKKTLAAQDEVLDELSKRFDHHVQSEEGVLERLAKKLEAPALNGGFESLVKNVEKIRTVQDQLGERLQETGSKVDAIHVAIYDPEKGLYAKVKDAIRWINNANWVIKGSLGLGATCGVAAFGKIVYDMITGHLHIIH